MLVLYVIVRSMSSTVVCRVSIVSSVSVTCTASVVSNISTVQLAKKNLKEKDSLKRPTV